MKSVHRARLDWHVAAMPSFLGRLGWTSCALGTIIPSAELIDGLDGKEEIQTRESCILGASLILDGRNSKRRNI